jgi:hypothetical protein
MDAERDWIILEQPPERAWIILEPQPCARCVELEAEVERLRGELARSRAFGSYQTNALVGLQVELAKRTKPKKPIEDVSKRQQRRRRAKLRTEGVGVTTYEDALRYLGRPRNTKP